MQMEKRRGSPRRSLKKPSRLGIAAGSLPVETVNISRHGALVKAKGRITVVLHFQGTIFRGRLVRAVPSDGETTTYALELDDPVDLDYY